MLIERKRDIEELKELLSDEYTDCGLVFASSSGTPIEGSAINRLFSKLISNNDLPKVVFLSIRHTSTVYELRKPTLKMHSPKLFVSSLIFIA